MKFTIKREEFLKSLLVVTRVIPQKAINIYYTFLKLVLKEEGLFLTGSNGDIAIENNIPFFNNNEEIIRNIEYGGILVNARILTEIVKKIDGEELTFEVIDSIIQIENEKSNFKLNGQEIEEYPLELDFKKNGANIILNSEEFINSVNEVAFSASIKDNRPVLTCVNFQCTGEEIVFIATDGARLSKKVVNCDVDTRVNANIPAKTLYEVSKLITNEEKIEIYIDNKSILFFLNNIIVYSRLVAGEYPNTSNIIPKNFFYTLEINGQELIDSMDRVSLFSGEKENVVKVTMSNLKIEVSSRSNQLGSGNEKINLAKFSGDRLEISFNSEYVTSAIRALKSEDVIISFIGPMKPFTITSKSNPKLIELITPLRSSQ